METDALRALWRACFDDTEDWVELFFSTAYAPERCRFLTRDGRLGAALYWLDVSCRGRKLAYLYAVGTAPAFRRQGLCRELLEKTHEDLAGLGYAGTLLLPGTEALGTLYRKLGYQARTDIEEIFCRAGAPVALRQIGPEEYAALRRRYLPEGGVIQEGACLDLLAKCARLYTGRDFLLAYQEEGPLAGLELLGDPGAAPGILAALGREAGAFRVPGRGRPFAMFHPLTPDAQCPGYFGIAFD